ncbi:MAG TPA: sugar phosphate isomerase/epimerase [Bacilli bacterium]
MIPKVALQLYSVRELTEKDFLGTIRKVADLGYEAVQFAGFFNHKEEALTEVLIEKHLSIAGAHVPIEELMSDNFSDIVAFNKQIGNDLIICPYLPETMRKTLDDVDKVVHLFNELGAKCKSRGMIFAYHNHDFEFEPFEGTTLFDLIFEKTDPDLVKIELDSYWAHLGNRDSKAIIEKYKGRIVSVHIKDGKQIENGKHVNTVIGEGFMDIQGIVSAAKSSGVEWLTVEQEQFDRDMIESIKLNAARLLEWTAAKNE